MNVITVMRMGERLVAVKTADAAGADSLRSEARILELLDHPGLVQFVDVDDGDDSVVMRTAFAGADTWATRPVDDPVERAAGIAAIAATVADLHARGVTHGALRAEHVIRSDDDRPVLCGLSRTRSDSDAAREADILALAELIAEPPCAAGPASVALSTLATRMRSGGCGAADVVDMANRIVADTVPQASGARRPTRRRLLGAAVLVALLVSATIAVAGAGQRSERRLPSTPAASGPINDSVVGPAASRAMPPPTTTVEPPSISDLQTGDGPRLDHAGRRYVVGREGDIVVVGDWNCDGDETPAVLRPATGEIAVFDRWPEIDGSISSPAAWNIESARDLVAQSDSGCDRLRVHMADGSRLLNSGASP
jgi:hypothetical protein